MKTRKLHTAAAIIAATFIMACQKSALIDGAPGSNQALQTNTSANTARGEFGPEAVTSTGPYTITLESRTQVGTNWEWVWSVQNPNPGNGGGGTVQNLSHWGMEFGFCLSLNSVVSAAYSADGVTWTGFTPTYQVDPSQQCYTSPIFKFDFGTTGGNKSYYKLVVNQNYVPGTVTGYYKSGKTTGCGIITFEGITCLGFGEPK